MYISITGSDMWQNLGEVSGMEAPLWYISTWRMAYIFACVLIWQKSMQKILLREGHCGNWSGFLGNAPERTFATLPSAHWMRVGRFNLSCDGCIWFIEGLVMLCSKFRVWNLLFSLSWECCIIRIRDHGWLRATVHVLSPILWLFLGHACGCARIDWCRITTNPEICRRNYEIAFNSMSISWNLSQLSSLFEVGIEKRSSPLHPCSITVYAWICNLGKVQNISGEN